MSDATGQETATGRLRDIPRGVWALGLVSLFMDISSEMVHSLLPVFFVSVIGLSYTSVGLIEGIAQSIALVTKMFSGVVSDMLRRRKPLALVGYGLAALTKPLFAIATGAGLVITARFLDRLGKGIRGAPRDALIADITPPEVRGASYGLRQSLDSVGAFVGPLLAFALMALLANDIRAVFWFALVPAAVAVLLLAFGVREPRARAGWRTECECPSLAGCPTPGQGVLDHRGDWRACSPWRPSARPSWYCARRTLGWAWDGFPWSLS